MVFLSTVVEFACAIDEGFDAAVGEILPFDSTVLFNAVQAIATVQVTHLKALSDFKTCLFTGSTPTVNHLGERAFGALRVGFDGALCKTVNIITWALHDAV